MTASCDRSWKRRIRWKRRRRRSGSSSAITCPASWYWRSALDLLPGVLALEVVHRLLVLDHLANPHPLGPGGRVGHADEQELLRVRIADDVRCVLIRQRQILQRLCTGVGERVSVLGPWREGYVVAGLHADGILADAHVPASAEDVDSLLDAGMKVVRERGLARLQLHPVDADGLRPSRLAQASCAHTEAALAASQGLDLTHVDHVRVPSGAHLCASRA